MGNKELLILYKCNSLEAAKKLFAMFERIGLDNLDKERFFQLHEKGGSDIGFCVFGNTWAVCPLDTKLYDIRTVDM